MTTVNLTMNEIRLQCNEKENNIIDLYLERKTQKEICKTLNITRGVIDTLVRKYQLTRFRDRKLSYCKYVKPEKPEFWYFLGLFASDGNLYYKSHSVDTIQFMLDDKDALDDVKNILGCTNEVKYYKKSGKWRWYLSISDPKVIQTVRNIFGGDCYKKTFNIKFPNIPNTKCLIMFLRGFIDGDGSFAKSTIKGFFNFKLFCASKQFAKSLYKKLIDIVHQGVHFYKEAYIEINAQKNVYNLMKFLYSYNPVIGIQRKRERAMQHINNYELKI